MKKLKDIFYDYNDIVIALGILVIAALLIVWRLDVILDYPEKLLNNDEPQIEKPVVDEDEDKDKDKDKDEDKNKDEENKDTNEGPVSIWADGKLTQEVKVSTEGGNTASEAIQRLVDKGLFESYSEYKKICDSININHEEVRADTFTFKAGTTKQDIARAVNWRV